VAAGGSNRGAGRIAWRHAAARLAAHLEPVLVKLEHGADATSAATNGHWPMSDALATGWGGFATRRCGVSAPVAAPPPEGGSLPTDWGGEGSLPTVPMELPGSVDDPHKNWIDAMREGDWIRLFLHARWLTARVAGRSSAHVIAGHAHGRTCANHRPRGAVPLATSRGWRRPSKALRRCAMRYRR
jgi:hypothetical protein